MVHTFTRRSAIGAAGLAFAAALLSLPAGGFAQEQNWDESPTIQAIKERGALRGGVALAAPTAFQDPASGELQGIVIEVGREAAKRLGVDFETTETGWDTIIAGLQADQYDVALAGLFETPQRLEVVDFVTVGEEGIAFLVRGDNDTITSADDLNSPDVTIATVTGSGSEQMIQQNFPDAQLKSILSPSGGSGAPPEEVLAGRVDAAQYDAVLTLAYQQRFPDLKAVPADAFEHPLFPTAIGVAVRKDDPLFKAFLQSVVDDLTSQGKIAEWRAQWSQPDLLLGN